MLKKYKEPLNVVSSREKSANFLTHELTPSDLERIREAAVVIYTSEGSVTMTYAIAQALSNYLQSMNYELNAILTLEPSRD